ncbi:hypothetical protein ACOTTU_21820 [Roseobacter sp. EG26]|uniref:hypothetical protein n=1 Tax=Roseobacter sp. EG26 TaxID=3412477 RepID=UPI003CE57DDE
MAQLRFKGFQTGSRVDVSTFRVGANSGSLNVAAFRKPSAVAGLPRISDGFDGDTLTVDTSGLTGVSAYLWRIVGGATQGTGPTLDSTGLGGSRIECLVSCDQGDVVSPPLMVYSTSHMGMASPVSHIADDAAVVALMPRISLWRMVPGRPLRPGWGAGCRAMGPVC